MLKPFFALLLLFSSIPALAECGSTGPPDVSYAAATAVFVATISPTGDRRHRFTRGKSWKGDAPEEFVLGDPDTWSSVDLHGVEEGVEYIVYATGNLHVNQCNRRKVLKQARIEAQYLDVLQGGAASELAPGTFAKVQDGAACLEAAGLMNENRSSARKDERMQAWLMPAVVQCAGDGIVAVRLAAVRALGNTRSDAGARVRIAALKDKDREVRAAAVPAVEGISNSALFPALAAALKLARADPNPDPGKQESLLASFAPVLRIAAVKEAEKDAAGKLLGELIDEIKDPMKRVFPLRQLGLMGPRARAAVPQLRRILQASDPTEQHSLKQYTISALGELGAVDMQASIEPYLKDGNCNVVAAVVQAVWKMNKAGFGKFFAEKGMPEMQSRFDRCNDLFIWRLQDMVPAGRELAPFLDARYADMADSDGMKPQLKRLLDSWKAAP